MWLLTDWTRADAISLCAVALAGASFYLSYRQHRREADASDPVLDLTVQAQDTSGSAILFLEIQNRSEHRLELHQVELLQPKGRRLARMIKDPNTSEYTDYGMLIPHVDDKSNVVPDRFSLHPYGTRSMPFTDTVRRRYLVTSPLLSRRAQSVSIRVSLTEMAESERSIRRVIKRTLPSKPNVETT